MGRDSSKVVVLLWVLAAAVAWTSVGWFVTDIGFALTGWLPASQGSVDWSTIVSYATVGGLVFLLFAALRRFALVPRFAWFGVALVEGIPVLLFLVALIALMLGPVPAWLGTHLVSKSDFGPLPPSEQLKEFATWWMWSPFFIVAGAWFGCNVVRPRRAQPQLDGPPNKRIEQNARR